jgi:hypothetical protein
MTAFTDALDLRTAVVEHVRRPDITDVWTRLVLLAEVGFNRKLRCREQVTRTTLTLASGSVALPSDFAELIGVYNANGQEYIQQPLQMVKETNPGGMYGANAYYAISGNALVSNGASGDRDVEYYAKVPTLSTSLTTSNWLLQKHPGLYLYGVALEAAKYMRDVELAQATKQLLDMEYHDVQADDDNARYSRARIRISGATP